MNHHKDKYKVDEIPYFYNTPSEYMPYFEHKNSTLTRNYFLRIFREILPVARYGQYEARETGQAHAFEKVAIIAYLMGMGYSFDMARNIVENWEVDGVFPK